jgi:asparagine synthase (glutamine-hydrolysing)
MLYRDRFWVVYNGEVYNYLELKAELQRLGHDFQSQSDTEVLLASYAEWGPSCFSRFRGMWGLAVFDCLRGEVILSRDRLGIKPLYWWRGNNIVAVVSEIKQLTAVPGFAAIADVNAGREFLETGYEDADRTFFRGVCPVPPGTWLRIHVDKAEPLSPNRFWHPERIQATINDRSQAGQLFSNKLRESVRLHLRSDVPVACALSGGLDSSTISVLADQYRRKEDGALQTFTATFPGEAVDERAWAARVTACLGATANYATPNPRDFLSDFSCFTWAHDEPVGSLSPYASFCVARLMRSKGISVTLNGQGGDEILSGYWQSYFMHLRRLLLQRRLGRLTGHLIGAVLPGGNSQLLQQIPFVLRRYFHRRSGFAKLRLRSAGRTDSSMLRRVMLMDEKAWRVEEIRSLYLPRLLRWEDRNAMAFSIEGRYPFLDHQLIELCLSFDSEALYQRGWTKQPLRLGLKGVLDKEIVQRRSKLGFDVPQNKWLCGPLRPDLQRWLAADRPVWEYVERSDVVQLAGRLWSSHRGHEESGQSLFRVYSFDHWLERFSVTSE